MKCPHCSAKIGLFSEEMKEVGKSGLCPKCNKAIKVGVIPLRFLAGFVPVAIASILLGVSGPLAAGIAGGVGGAVGIGLKRSEA